MKKVRIFYKSGNSIDITCSSFAVEWHRDTGAVTEVSWNGAAPRPIFMGVDNIEAVYEL